MAAAPTIAAPTLRRRRRAIGAIVALGIGWALIMQSLGWAQTSYYAMVKALSEGTAQIDRYHWETRDKSYINGHFFSVKAPGLPFLLTPFYAALDAVGARKVAADAAHTARAGGANLWYYRGLNVHQYGGDRARAKVIKARLEDQAPLVWALGLIGTVVPAVLLLWLIWRRVERYEPGYGALTAISIGTGTMIMPFAVQLFSHVLAALLAFGAFLLAWRERERPAARLPLLVLAGFLSGLAVTTEYPLAIAGGIVGLYAVLRPGVAGVRAYAARAGTYAAGVVAGVVPLLAYNLWAFGSVTTLSYDDAVNEQGTTGHETLGLNGGGFFGITTPKLRQAIDLLISPRGLFDLMPVLIMAGVGTWLLYKKGRKAEALVIAAICLAYYVYDTGYWLPFGGGSPGPRFLIPILPFLAIGLACAWRRFPGPTLALAIPSAVVMIGATISYPLVGTGNTWQWAYRIEHDTFQHTVFSLFGLDNGWPTMVPVVGLFVAAWWLAYRAAPRIDVRPQIWASLAALGAWGLFAGVLSPAWGEENVGGPLAKPTGFYYHHGLHDLVPVALVLGVVVLVIAWWRSPKPVDHEGPADAAPDAEARDRAPRALAPRAPADVAGMQHDGPHPEPA